VVKALEQALVTHELVKVRVLADADADLETMGSELGQATGSALAQNIGRVLLFYRPHPQKPRIELPRAETGGKR